MVKSEIKKKNSSYKKVKQSMSLLLITAMMIPSINTIDTYAEEIVGTPEQTVTVPVVTNEPVVPTVPSEPLASTPNTPEEPLTSEPVEEYLGSKISEEPLASEPVEVPIVTEEPVESPTVTTDTETNNEPLDNETTPPDEPLANKPELPIGLNPTVQMEIPIMLLGEQTLPEPVYVQLERSDLVFTGNKVEYRGDLPYVILPDLSDKDADGGYDISELFEYKYNLVGVKNMPEKARHNGNSPGLGCFNDCSKLEYVDRIPEITGNTDRFFSSCNKFNQEITVPEGPTSSNYMFQQCYNYNKKFKIPKTVISAEQMMYSCYKFNQYLELHEGLLNIFGILGECRNYNQNITVPTTATNIRCLLSGCIDFNSDIDIPDNIKDTGAILSYCSSYNRPLKLPSQAEDVSNALENCTEFNSTIDMGDKVTDAESMLEGCSKFNQSIHISKNLINAENMFKGCVKFNKELYFYKSIMNLRFTFSGCVDLNSNIIFEEGGNEKDTIQTFVDCLNLWNRPYIPNITNEWSGLYVRCPQGYMSVSLENGVPILQQGKIINLKEEITAVKPELYDSECLYSDDFITTIEDANIVNIDNNFMLTALNVGKTKLTLKPKYSYGEDKNTLAPGISFDIEVIPLQVPEKTVNVLDTELYEVSKFTKLNYTIEPEFTINEVFKRSPWEVSSVVIFKDVDERDSFSKIAIESENEQDFDKQDILRDKLDVFWEKSDLLVSEIGFKLDVNEEISGDSKTKKVSSDVSIDKEGTYYCHVDSFVPDYHVSDFKITVGKKKEPQVITINNKNLTMNVGDQLPLDISVSNINEAVDLSYTSLDNSICTVTDKGNLTGVAKGEATINILDSISKSTASCKITVQDKEPDKEPEKKPDKEPEKKPDKEPEKKPDSTGGNGGSSEAKHNTEERKELIEELDKMKDITIPIKRGEIANLLYKTYPYLTTKNEYLDVYEGVEYRKEIEGVSTFIGYPDGSFRPERTITRAEVAVLISKLPYNQPKVDSHFMYKDISEDDWYAPYIKDMRNKSLMIGDKDGNFRPMAQITQSEASMVVRRLIERE